MEQVQACLLLGVNLPIDEAGLKSAFRRRSRETHPDHGGTSNDFVAVNNAYELLKALVGSELVFTHDMSGMTLCGRPLKDLGQGYPSTQSARTCDHCRGAGYTTDRIRHGDCPSCDGQGVYTTITRRCNCIWTWPTPLRRCKQCNGTGRYIWLQLKRPHTCRFCSGTGFKSKVSQHVHSLCSHCRGIGEIMMWNPVIPRGRLG